MGTLYYNLDLIIAVGYRVKSVRGTQFRIWRKILDIYAASIDYNAKDQKTKEFFKTVQNKMHYAIHKNNIINYSNN